MRSILARISLLACLGLTLGTRSAATASPAAGQAPQAVTPRAYLPLVQKNYYPGGEWSQEAHDAQRTGYTPTEPLEPWALIWTWNGPDASGGAGNHIYDAPREARTVTGGNYIYAPAGASGMYALAKANGQVGWHLTPTTFTATVAYDSQTGSVFAGGMNGTLYKINADTSGIVGMYVAGGPLSRSILLAGSYVYAVTDTGVLHKVNTTTMTLAWAAP